MKRAFIILLTAVLICVSACAPKQNQSPSETNPTTSDASVSTAPTGTEPASDPEPSSNPAETDPEPLPPIAPPTEPPAQIVYNENGFTPRALMYHLVMEEPFNNLTALFVRPGDFAAQLAAFNEQGYTYLFANDYQKTEGKSVMVTFDDGYEDNYTTMFPILKEYGARATVFLITNMIDTPGYMTTAQIKEMADSGYVFFGCHTANHVDLSKQTPERVRAEFEESIAVIESITGQKCDALAYPSGGQNASVNEIAEEYFKYAYLARPTVPDGVQTNMKIPRIYVARDLSVNELLRRMGN